MGDVVQLHPTARPAGVPALGGRVPLGLRQQSGQRYGSISGEELASILVQLDEGRLEQWCDLVRYVLDTDPDVASLYSSRVSRLVQADWVVAPGEYGDATLARQAADFIRSKILPRIDRWSHSIRSLAGACAPGLAVAQKEWRRDDEAGYWYIARLQHEQPWRFRYGPLWDLRLYDRGFLPGTDGNGRLLEPNLWVTHFFPVQDGPPSTYGLMKATVWPWLFCRFGDKSNVLLVEKNGHPILYGVVPQGTPEPTRRRFFEGLQNLSYDHVEVVEEGVTIQSIDMKGKEGSDVHDAFLRRQLERMTRRWLGTSDANTPGAHGSIGAVEGRISAFTDPLMVDDGDLLASTIERDIFASALEINSHLFAAPVANIPVPKLRLKTAHDEIRPDAGDATEERSPEPSQQLEGAEKVQDTALNGAQVASLLEIARSVRDGVLTPANALALITAAFPTIDQATATRIIPQQAPVAAQPVPQLSQGGGA